MDITSKAYYEKIDACRQVVNVYKHGDGHAHRCFPSRILSIIRISIFQEATDLVYVMSNLRLQKHSL